MPLVESKPQNWTYFVFAQNWPPAACLDVPHGQVSFCYFSRLNLLKQSIYFINLKLSSSIDKNLPFEGKKRKKNITTY